MDLNIGGCRDAGGKAEVSAKAESAGGLATLAEARPCADTGGGSVGADEPAGAELLTVKGGRLAGSEDDGRPEGEADAESGGAFAKELVKGGASDSDAGEGGEIGADAGVGVGEGDAGEGQTVRFVGDAEGGEGAARGGHEALAAGLVDGRLAGIGEQDVGAAQAKGNGGSEAGGPCTGDEHVTVVVTHTPALARGDEVDLGRAALGKPDLVPKWARAFETTVLLG
jgi:hypothetical protein